MAVPSVLLSALLLGTACAWLAAGLPLPSFLEKCPRDNRAQLNECAARQTNILIPHVINGMKKYSLMALDPMYVPKVALNQPGLNIILSNIYLYGMTNLKVTSVDFDLEKKRLTFVCTLRQLTINSTYTMEGKFLFLRLKGEGDSSVEFHDLVGKYEAELDTVKRKDGDDHFTIKDHRYNFSTETVRYYFSNLFNGDRRLGKVTNDFINENWQEVSKETQPAVAEIAGMTFTTIMQGMWDSVPIKDMFAEGPRPVA